MMYCIKKLKGRPSPMAVFASTPVLWAITVVIIPASTGFGGWVPPIGVRPVKASSVNAPVIKPVWISPRMAPVKVQTISGRKIYSASNQKSIPTISAMIASPIPCIIVISCINNSVTKGVVGQGIIGLSPRLSDCYTLMRRLFTGLYLCRHSVCPE